MTSTQRPWMATQAHAARQTELASRYSRPPIEASDDMMDCAAPPIAALREGQGRIREFHEPVVGTAVDRGPDENGIAEPGMVVTIYYDDTGEIETFLLGVADDDIAVHSILSPLGQAIAGARPGEQRAYSVPSATRRNVTLLHAVPYGRYIAKRVGSQGGPPRTARPRRRGTITSTQQKPNPFWTTALCTAV